jgi:hypothetical protein
VARPLNFIETASGASGIVIGLASIPSGADNAVIRVDGGTVRWSETASIMLTASSGILLSGADPPFRIDGGGAPSGGLSRFRAYVMGSAAIQVLYYSYEGRSFIL